MRYSLTTVDRKKKVGVGAVRVGFIFFILGPWTLSRSGEARGRGRGGVVCVCQGVGGGCSVLSSGHGRKGGERDRRGEKEAIESGSSGSSKTG